MPEIGDWRLAETPWPHIAGPRVRVRVSERRYLFGTSIVGDKRCEYVTVLTDGGKVVQAQKGDVQ